MRSFILLGLLFSIISIPAFSQTFPCDGNLLLSTNSRAGFTVLYRVDFGPFGTLFYNQLNQYQDNFNALGFNSVDNYIYAATINSNELVRLKADNSFEIIGKVPNLDKLTTTAGACTPDGYYLCHDQVLDQILVFDVVDTFALVNQIDLYWDTDSPNSGSFTARIDDFAIDPTNTRVAYSFQGDYFDADLAPPATKGYLLQINLDFQSPDLGKVTPVASLPTDIARKIGSLKFTTDGSLFGYGGTATDANGSQNYVLSINKFSGAVGEFVTRGPSAIDADGCSCPYNLIFSNLADPNFAPCSDSKLTYILTLENQTFHDIPNASLIDTLPEGMLVSNITGNFSGNVAVGTGIGTRILQIDNLQVAAKSVITIQLETSIVDFPTGIISNQAILINLPDKFEYDRVSDDPENPSANAPTNIFSDVQRLETFDISITNPTDCFKPEDSKVVITAPVLIPSVEYEINMRNEEYEEFTKTVWVDEQHTFVIDSLPPGEYTFYKITPINSQCGFAMKDTTITIVGPNELIQAAVTANGPVCEGATLQLAATVFPPEGTVEWSGPNGFRATDLNIVIDSSIFEQSGLYEMVFTYGVCEQIRELDIVVHPEIAATIGGPGEFCERDTLRLIAEGEGDLQTFTWTNPAGRTLTDSILEMPFASSAQEGWYELIIDNGSCRDSTREFIRLLPTPTLHLPEVEISEFCDPLVLRPNLSGDLNVSYDWQPNEGLSCTDCPNPSIVRPTTPYYQLKVENEFACQDSADVLVFLEPTDLIYIPTIFSPNGDGINDYFQLFPNCGVAEINRFQVYHRSGSMVYALEAAPNFSNQDLFWDGLMDGRPANIGVYLWLLELTLIDGTKRELSGDVTLLR